MADFGYDWDMDEDDTAEIKNNNNTEEEVELKAKGEDPIVLDTNSNSLPPGVVVHRVAASEKQGNPHGTTESELLEPMIEDKAKQLEVKTLEDEEDDTKSPLEVFCQRSCSVFIFQRVWAAKEVCRLLVDTQLSQEIAMGVLVPIAMRLCEDQELFVRETMAQNLLPVLQFYFAHKEIMADSKDRGNEHGEENSVVPPAQIPSSESFGAWLHRVLLASYPSVSLPAQRATVGLGHKLDFDSYHREIVHGVILGLVQNPIHQHIMRQRERSKEMVVKSRDNSEPSSRRSSSDNTAAGSGIFSLFNRRSWQSDKDSSNDELDLDAIINTANRDSGDINDQPTSADSNSGFFVSPADEEARLELIRRKLLMLHMIHLVAVEFGANMRPAVFVPVVERSSKDKAFEVRRDAAAVLGSLAKAVSNDLALDVLFQCFLHLSQDTIWQVRQSAARHALPGLALVLATRQKRPPVMSKQLGDFERKYSLQKFAQLPYSPFPSDKSMRLQQQEQQEKKHQQQLLQRLSLNVKADSRMAQLAGSSGQHPSSSSTSTSTSASSSSENKSDDDVLGSYMYQNEPSRSVPDKQWLQIVDRLASTREPSHHVRAAVFESVGKLVLALVDCTKTRDALVALVVDDVQRVNTDSSTGAGRFGLFGSSSSLQSMGSEDDDDENERYGTNDMVEVESAEAEEAAAVMASALGEIQGVAPTTASSAASSLASKLGFGSKNSSSKSTVPANAGLKPKMKPGNRAVNRDILYQCAYNFPALLASLGSQGWSRLRDVYMQLSKVEHFEARQTLASSLHEVARILATTETINKSKENSETASTSYSADLESVLCLFLIDDTEIKMSSIRHLGEALTWLPSDSRMRCLPMVMQVFKHDGKQWRTRKLMAEQLVMLCHLFQASVVVGSLLPQAVEWAHDAVSGVRAAIAPAFPIIFELTKLDPATQVKFFETVISFSHASSFRGRLFFIEICSALLAHDQDPDSDPVDFDQFFLPSLASLANDKVVNVRIALARLVRRMLENRMRRQSISATLADVWITSCPNNSSSNKQEGDDDEDDESNWEDIDTATSEKRQPSTGQRKKSRSRRPTRSSSSSGSAHKPTTGVDTSNSRFYSHRSLESVARRTRRNTTPMRAHLLAIMIQQLAADKDRDVLDLVKDLPGQPGISNTTKKSLTVASKHSSAPSPVTTSAAEDESVFAQPIGKPGLKVFPKPPPSPPLLPEKPTASAISQPADPLT